MTASKPLHCQENYFCVLPGENDLFSDYPAVPDSLKLNVGNKKNEYKITLKLSQWKKEPCNNV